MGGLRLQEPPCERNLSLVDQHVGPVKTEAKLMPIDECVAHDLYFPSGVQSPEGMKAAQSDGSRPS